MRKTIFIVAVFTAIMFGSNARTATTATTPPPPDAAQEQINTTWIEINIPAYRLDLYDGRTLKKTFMVGVGQPSFPTSRRGFVIRQVMWNPWWSPPPESEWAKGRGTAPPGPMNPLGPVKMILAGSALLIHGTDKPESIGETSSHGCIRMMSEDAIDLAYSVMQLAGTTEPMKTPEAYIAMKGSPLVNLKNTVGVKIVYRRVEVRDGQLMIHPDPYKGTPLTVANVQETLKAAGYQETVVAANDIEKMIKFSAHGTVLKSLPAFPGK